MNPPTSPELLDIAATVLPGVDLTAAQVRRGQDHDVVLVADVAAIRVTRHSAAATLLPRRLELLRRLAEVGLPFATPEPLTDAVKVGGRAAAATTWIRGGPDPGRRPGPTVLAALLGALKDVDPGDLADVLDRPHAYAGRERWYELMVDEAVPRLPRRLRAEALARTDQAAALPPVEASLVHGDLAGYNVHWGERGDVVGVVDWDLAQPFDPAVDAACLAGFGWDALRRAVDDDTFNRAMTWWRTFGIEQIVAAVLNDDRESDIEKYVARTVSWLDKTPPSTS